MARELQVWKPLKDLIPFGELDRMRKDMDRLWEAFLQRKPTDNEEEFSPALDLSETANELIVKCEIPGMERKDIDISLSDGMLNIKGEKKQEREEKKADYHLVERSYGSFTRSIQLPKEVQSDKISASYKNGILTVTLPKSEEAKKKETKIKIQ